MICYVGEENVGLPVDLTLGNKFTESQAEKPRQWSPHTTMRHTTMRPEEAVSEARRSESLERKL